MAARFLELPLFAHELGDAERVTLKVEASFGRCNCTVVVLLLLYLDLVCCLRLQHREPFAASLCRLLKATASNARGTVGARTFPQQGSFVCTVFILDDEA